MLKTFLFILAAAVAFGAGDPWLKVKDIKAGTDLRVFRKGKSQPLLVQMGELTADNLVVIQKKTEIAIPREEIDEIDSRPPKSTWVKNESTTATKAAFGADMGSRDRSRTCGLLGASVSWRQGGRLELAPLPHRA